MTIYSTWGPLGRLHEQMEIGDSALEFGQAEMRSQIQALYRTVHELAVTLHVTMETLHGAGLLDPVAIQAQVAQQLADKGATLVACVQCGKNVPARETTRTPMGVVCAACSGR
jgi:DNA-directed RNA polymerase subunit RPC12/RpoP